MRREREDSQRKEKRMKKPKTVFDLMTTTDVVGLVVGVVTCVAVTVAWVAAMAW